MNLDFLDVDKEERLANVLILEAIFPILEVPAL